MSIDKCLQYIIIFNILDKYDNTKAHTHALVKLWIIKRGLWRKNNKFFIKKKKNNKQNTYILYVKKSTKYYYDYYIIIIRLFALSDGNVYTKIYNKMKKKK